MTATLARKSHFLGHIQQVIAWGVLGLATIVWALRQTSPRRVVLSLELCRPTAAHPFGCGENGVDLLSLAAEALVRGCVLASCVALTGLAIGTGLGALAGLRGGVLSRLLQRFCDGVAAFPMFVLTLVLLSAVRNPTRWHVGVLLAVSAWTPFCRLALAELRVVRGLAYVEAARALGAPTPRIIWAHILPSILPTARAQLGLSASGLLVSEAALAFLGLGPSDGVSLGALVDQGVGSMLRAPHVLFVGAAALALAAWTLQRLGDPR